MDFGRPVSSSTVFHVPTGELSPANVLTKPSQKSAALTIHFIEKIYLK
jgi:hypothetical protein